MFNITYKYHLFVHVQFYEERFKILVYIGTTGYQQPG